MSTTTSSGPLTGPHAAAGPLVVSAANPRYFVVAPGSTGSTASGDHKAIYLTGSHIWNNFHDGLGPGPACAGEPEQNDFGVYLAFLKDHGHNFIRLWRWEQFRSQAAGGSFHLCMTPQPWARIGPGAATDGKPKFDLSQFDPGYFDRLRERVVAAGNAGIYVSVMLFEGWGLHLSPAPDNVEGHPFHAANNVNGIGIASIVDYQQLPLDPRVQALQEAYVRKVVDTLHDLPNVLYEVANESSGGGRLTTQLAEALRLTGSLETGDSTRWQYWVIDFVKEYERRLGYDQHPIGMTMQYPVADQRRVNEPLFGSPADWISPGFDDEDADPGRPPEHSRWLDNPPASDGRKVVITDTDHYAPMGADALWAWKSFLRGHHPILMDFGIIDVTRPLDPSLGVPAYESFEPARHAMGDTRRYAERMQLLDMEPHGDLSSTGYALANPGQECLVLQPLDTAEPFTVTLAAGTYAVEWFSIDARQTREADRVTVECDGSIGFAAPFAEARPAVLYLKRVA
jgi:hypothetical protein